MQEVNIFWFRRDLRLDDNAALSAATHSDLPVLPVFIFDKSILDRLEADDARLSFIHESLREIHDLLRKKGSGIKCLKGTPEEAWNQLLREYRIRSVYFNRDYEPYALDRDQKITDLLVSNGINVFDHKDQVIFEKHEVVKNDGTPYTVYTPYKNKWLEKFNSKDHTPDYKTGLNNYHIHDSEFPTLTSIGFKSSSIKVPSYDLNTVANYDSTRDLPSVEGTSRIGPHLRFGTVSIRRIIDKVKDVNSVYLSELIWREFFMQILYHFPHVIESSFRKKYDAIPWRNNEDEFKNWCDGNTGYPIVDAGMRELNQTGYMHNRVRMITASFLCKHLLIDWRWGEAYFAEKLLDFELASNNGNWQWAAGTGCDAAPYFRVFNPYEQTKKFDKDLEYIRKWVPEMVEPGYPSPIVDHKEARVRAINTYKKALNNI